MVAKVSSGERRRCGGIRAAASSIQGRTESSSSESESNPGLPRFRNSLSNRPCLLGRARGAARYNLTSNKQQTGPFNNVAMMFIGARFRVPAGFRAADHTTELLP